MNLKKLFKKEEKKYLEEMIKFRRKIHSNPETGFKEYDTSNFIYNYLKDIGIKRVEKGIGKTGVVALIEGKKEGKTIGLRADIDALQIHEKNKLAFSSKNPGVMHACGHDGHIAMLLGAARVLHEKK